MLFNRQLGPAGSQLLSCELSNAVSRVDPMLGEFFLTMLGEFFLTMVVEFFLTNLNGLVRWVQFVWGK